MKHNFGRRSFFSSAAGLLGATFWADETIEAYQDNVRTASKPSDLRITDVRMAMIGGGLIRLDTNQGVYGIGENRDGASRNYVMELKRIVVGENPCCVDKVFRRMKQFGYHARQGGGVSGMEMALWDLAGKVYNVPIYQMLGGKFRDRIRVYCDTPMANDQKVFAERVKMRKAEGFTWFKCDVGTPILANIPGTMSYPAGADIGVFIRPQGQAAGAPGGRGGQPGRGAAMPPGPRNLPTQHMFTGLELTDKGIGVLCDYLGRIRETIGFDVPLSTDHYGHFGVNSGIRLGKAFEKFNLAWMEDIIPWQHTDLWKTITDSIDVPTLTGEDIYLKEEFLKLARNHSVDILQPDIATSGGILETHKIGDMIQEYGVPMVLHMANSPVSAFASVHVAAATENFLVLENHSVDNPAWGDVVDGVEKPIVNKGFITVPEGPGLGFKLNEEAIKKSLRQPGYFEPTPEWDNRERVNDRLWSRLGKNDSIWLSV